MDNNIVVRYLETVDEFDADLQLTLADIRGHFGISGGSLKVDGKIKVVKADMIVPPGNYVSAPAAVVSPSTPPKAEPTPTATRSMPPSNTTTFISPSVPLPSTPITPTTPTVPQSPSIQTAPSTPTVSSPTKPEKVEPTSSASPIPEPISPLPSKIAASVRPSVSITTTSITTTQSSKPKRGLSEAEKSSAEAKKPKPDPTSFSVPLPSFPQASATQIKTEELFDFEAKSSASILSQILRSSKEKADQVKQSGDAKQKETSTCNKENELNGSTYDWKTRINISTTTTSNVTSSLIASITSSSKPSTPERKRQKNEIITKILAREADRKTLRETFMDVEQIKGEMSDEDKTALSTSEVLHLCEVSWFNKVRDGERT